MTYCSTDRLSDILSQAYEFGLVEKPFFEGDHQAKFIVEFNNGIYYYFVQAPYGLKELTASDALLLIDRHYL